LPLAALIAAQDQVDDGHGLRATLPLAGRTLLEYQAGLAIDAGATHVVILVERVPALLAQAVERLRLTGARVEIARSVADAADRLHPDETILLIGDGAVAAPEAVAELAGPAPHGALLTVPDTQDHACFERIDATHRWAGFARLDKSEFEATARMLGDWDMSSTLLRRLVQADALRIDALNPTGERPVAAPLIVADAPAMAGIERALVRRADPVDGNWVEFHLHRLLSRPLMPLLVKRRVERGHLALAAAAMALVAPVAAAWGLFWLAVLLLPLAAAMASAARGLARIWGTGGGLALSWPDLARGSAALATLLLLSRYLASEAGWGWWSVAAVPPVALAGLAGLRPIVRALGSDPPPRWLASADALVWTAPPLAILGGWRWMMVGLAAYGAGSFLERFKAAWKEARNCDK